MFPSLLYDFALSPSIRRCISTVDEPLFLDQTRLNQRLDELLNKDNKEILSQPQDLLKAISQTILGTNLKSDFLLEQCQLHFNFLQEFDLIPLKIQLLLAKHDKMDDQFLVHIISLLFKRKIVIYEVNETHLECQVVNFGFTQRIDLAQLGKQYSLVGKIGTQDKLYFCKSIIYDILKDNFKIDFRQVAPITRHKRSYSDPFKYISEQKDQKKYRILNEPLSPSTISSSRVSQSASKVFDQFTFPNEQFTQEEVNQTPSFQSPQEVLSQLKLNIQDNGQNILSKVRHTGTLKFFDETKSYGFIIMDIDGSDIFVHQDDLQKAGLSKEFLRTAKLGNMIRFSFLSLSYVGKYNRSRKAVDLQVLQSGQQKYQFTEI